MRVIFVENYHVSINATAVAEGITKIFPGVRALENVQLDLWPGKVTALIGETAREIHAGQSDDRYLSARRGRDPL